MTTSDDADAALTAVTEELYGLHPTEFVSGRDELVRRLRGEGRREVATAVGKLRRPSPAAWAVNQLSRRDRARVEELVRSGDRLRAAQDRALAGGAADELRDAARERREAVVALADTAAGLLAERGLAVDAHRQEIADTLDAASLDPQAAAAVLAGRLSSALEPPSGFGDVEGASMGPPDRAPVDSAEPSVPEAAAARGAAAEARRVADDLSAKAAASAARAERRRRELESARAEVARLERELDAARQRVDLAAEDAEAARRDAVGAQEAASGAAARLQAAEAHLREVTGSV